METHRIIAILALGLLSYSTAAYGQPEAAPPKPLTPEQVSQLIGAPTLVTLQRQGTKPAAAFAELARQAGIPVNTAELGANNTINVNIVGLPFWMALRSLLAGGDVSLNAYNADQFLSFQDNPTGNLRGPLFANGPFLVGVEGARKNASTELHFGLDATKQRESNAQLTMNMDLFPDPKLRLMGRSPMLRVDALVDDKGRSWAPDEKEVETNGAGASLLWEQFEFNLKPGVEPNTRIAEFNGALKVLVVVKTDRWKIEDVLQAQNVTKTVPRAGGAVNYTLRRVTVTDDEYIVQLGVPASDWHNDTPDSPNLGDFHLFARLLDADGHDLQFANSNEGGQGDTLSETLHFSRTTDEDKPAQPAARLVIEIPEVRVVEIPFEFHNLPLP